MKRRAIAVVLVLIVVGAGTALFLLPGSSDSYHYEMDLPEGDFTRVTVHLEDIQDCALNVSFVDDPELWYSLDIQLYASIPADSAFDLSVIEGTTLLQVHFEGKVKIKSLQLVLGSGVPYGVGVLGSDVNATVAYGNNAMGSGASFDFHTTGSFVNLIITEDMVFSEESMEVFVGTGGVAWPDNVYLTLDLPDDVNGFGQFTRPLSVHASTGWTWQSEVGDFTSYGTEDHSLQPRIDLAIRAVYSVHVWLSD